jgi:hypothetical protein
MSNCSPPVRKLLKQLTKNYHARKLTGQTNPVVCAAIVNCELSPEEIRAVDRFARRLIGQGTEA